MFWIIYKWAFTCDYPAGQLEVSENIDAYLAYTHLVGRDKGYIDTQQCLHHHNHNKIFSGAICQLC